MHEMIFIQADPFVKKNKMSRRRFVPIWNGAGVHSLP